MDEDAPPPPPSDIPNIVSVHKGIVEDDSDVSDIKLRKVDESEKHYVTMMEMIEKLQGDVNREVYGETIGKFMTAKAKSKMDKSDYRVWHGALGKKEWKLPKLAAKSYQPNRSDQLNYTNDPKVLNEKMKIVADLLRKSKFTLVYSGAGISRQAGIADYATKATDSVMKSVQTMRNPASAKPTYSHYSITHLERNGLVHYYVQQNHDGLPQKAGFPQEKMNEVHGGWFDISNPVVSFSGNLRSDLFKDMLKVEQKTTLCLCLGTSLSGMNADRCVMTPAQKFVDKKEGFYGSVIVNLQETPLDMSGYCPIRVWAKIDDAFECLMKHLEIDVKPCAPKRENAEIECPYNKYGQIDKTKKMILSLAMGQKVKVVQPHSVMKGKVGRVVNRNAQGNFLINFPGGTKILGYWWLNVIKEGRMPQIPFVNENPKFVK